MSSIKKIKGFSDLLPETARRYSFMEDRARDVFSRFGFQEIRIPILEKTELFARSIGDETDIVQKEMYTSPDRKGRSLSLRPEATAGVVRAYVENNLQAREKVSKLFCFGPMFRYERPQKGRQRQFHQINVEAFGSSSPIADAEIILMLWSFLREINLKNIGLEINSLGCRACRPAYQQRLQEHLALQDRSSLCEDCQRRTQANPLRIFDCKSPHCASSIASAPPILEHVCSACRDHFATVRTLLESMDIPYTVNPKLVRGLDYYQRTTFEVISENIGAQSAIAGGGRYDGLVSLLGGPDIPGIGFACGMERLNLLLEEVSPQEPDFYIAVLDEQAFVQGNALAGRLREKGYKGELSYDTGSLKSQMRQANKLGSRFCLLLGSEETARGQVTVKNMATGEQTTVQQDAVEAQLQTIETRK